MSIFQVTDHRFDEAGAVFEVSQNQVASYAKKAADRVCFMVMVYRQILAVSLPHLRLLANSALSALRLQEGVVLFRRHPIQTLQSARAIQELTPLTPFRVGQIIFPTVLFLLWGLWSSSPRSKLLRVFPVQLLLKHASRASKALLRAIHLSRPQRGEALPAVSTIPRDTLLRHLEIPPFRGVSGPGAANAAAPLFKYRNQASTFHLGLPMPVESTPKNAPESAPEKHASAKAAACPRCGRSTEVSSGTRGVANHFIRSHTGRCPERWRER